MELIAIVVKSLPNLVFQKASISILFQKYHCYQTFKTGEITTFYKTVCWMNKIFHRVRKIRLSGSILRLHISKSEIVPSVWVLLLHTYTGRLNKAASQLLWPITGSNKLLEESNKSRNLEEIMLFTQGILTLILSDSYCR